MEVEVDLCTVQCRARTSVVVLEELEKVVLKMVKSLIVFAETERGPMFVLHALLHVLF